MTDFERIVIVGAGVAGLRAAERLRELDYDGELVIIGDEPRWPYHRPLVSKDLLAGAGRPADLTLQRHVDTGARWRLGTRAERLETQRKVVHLPGGEEIKYDGLIIATGVEPRHLRGVPRHSARVHTLRTVDEALAVKKTIARSDLPVVVLGTGYIGCDVAASARKMGRDVTMVGRSRFPLRNLGNDVAAAVDKLHRKHRVRMAMGTDIRNWICADDSVAMHTTDGQLLVAGTVIMAVGSVPAVEWMRGSGLVLEDGVLCESTLFAAGAQDVVVAGDCGRWPNLRFDDTPRRVEHWINAVEMGRHAAQNLLAGRDKATPFMPVPRVWSGQYGVRLQISGVPSLGTDTVHLADGAAGTPGITGYVRDGKLVGVCGWDAPRAMIKWTGKLHEELPVPAGTKPRRPVAAKPGKPVSTPDVTRSVRPPVPPARQNTVAELPTEVPAPVPAMASIGGPRFPAPLSAPAMRPVAGTGRAMRPVPPARRRPAAVPPAMRRPMPAMPRGAGQPPRDQVPPLNGHAPPSARGMRPVEQPPGRHARHDPGPLTEPVPPVRPEPEAPTSSIPNLAAPNLAMSNLAMPHIAVPDTPAAAMLPGPPPARHRTLPPMPPTRGNQHPSFPNMQPVPRPGGAHAPEHPSFPNMRPVQQPMPLPEHPSFPGMQPVARPATQHPSFPAMRPVARPGTDDHRFPAGEAIRGFG